MLQGMSPSSRSASPAVRPAAFSVGRPSAPSLRAADRRLIRLHSPTRSRRAFSLTEMLVAISIILLIAGLVVVARQSLLGDVQRKQTQVILGNLQNAHTEYEVATGGQILHYSDGSERPDWSVDKPRFSTADNDYTASTGDGLTAGTAGIDDDAQTIIGPPADSASHVTIRRFVYAAWQSETARPMIEQQKDRLIKLNNGYPYVEDAWGTPVYYADEILPSGNPLPSDDRFKPSPDPVFISAGPDGEFGDVNNFMDNNASDRDVNGDGTGDGIDDSKDNLYSTEF